MNWYSQVFYVFNCVTVAPQFCFVLHRLMHQDYYSRPSYVPKAYSADNWFRLFVVVMVVYYSIDSVYLLIQYDRMDMCNLAFFLHHVITLVGGPAMLTLPHYPWFVLSVFAWHCLLVMFPELTYLNYGYLALAATTVYGLNQDPWTRFSQYRTILYVLYGLLLIPLPMLWFFNCRNDMENVL